MAGCPGASATTVSASTGPGARRRTSSSAAAPRRLGSYTTRIRRPTTSFIVPQPDRGGSLVLSTGQPPGPRGSAPDAAKPDVTGGGVDRLGLASGRAVAQAVTGG